MKQSLRVLMLIAVFAGLLKPNAQAQFFLEHTYDSSAASLKYVNFRLNGEKYVRIHYPANQGPTMYACSNKIDIYNLDHSLWKSISLDAIPFFPPSQVNGSDGQISSCVIFYVSDGLFNNDSLIEFLFAYNNVKETNEGAKWQYHTFIYNENMEVIFSDSTAGPWYFGSEIPQTYLPVVNTSQGTKMILSSGYPDYVARVYGLAGQLTGVIEQPNGPDVPRYENKSGMSLYPNPAKNYTTVQYDLPIDINTAQLVFYDMAGTKLKSFTIDHSFSNIVVSTTDLASGTYYCQIETVSRVLPGKKMVKIN